MPRAAAPTLALVVITLDEEANIADCLASVAGLAGQLVVVDSGSTDRTRAIAEAAGAEVFTEEFLGYGRQKQLAAGKARCDWLLFLDADERLDDEARAAVRALLDSPPPEEVTGFRLRTRTSYLGAWVAHGPWQNETKMRLVRRGAAHWKPDVVHESLELTSGSGRLLPGRILHFPYRDIGHQLRKIDRYSAIIAARDAETRAPRVWLGMVLEPPFVFFQKYVLQLGVLDGWRGYLAAALTSLDFFLRWARVRERRPRPDARDPEPVRGSPPTRAEARPSGTGDDRRTGRPEGP